MYMYMYFLALACEVNIAHRYPRRLIFLYLLFTVFVFTTA